MNQVNQKSGFTASIKADAETVEPVELGKSATPLILGTKDAVKSVQAPETASPGPAETEASRKQPAAKKTAAPKPVDAEFVLRALHSGDNKVAKQADLVNLNKSIVSNMKMLGSGIGDQVSKSAAADRQKLDQRISDMEHAVNGMEGLLRIQLAPEIKKMIDAGFQEHIKSTPSRFRGKIAVLFLICAAFAGGTVFSDQILNIANIIAARLGEVF